MLNSAAENMQSQKDGDNVQQEMKNIFRPGTPRYVNFFDAFLLSDTWGSFF